MTQSPLRKQLLELKQLAEKASGTFPKNRQLADAMASQVKEYRRQMEGVLDKMVDELRRAATVVIPAGPAEAIGRLAAIAGRSGALVIDASAAYADLCRELAVRAGVAKEEAGKIVSVKRSRQTLTADQVHFLVEGSQPAWLRRSYYAAKGARSFNQPAPPRNNELWYEDMPELVRRVKAQYAATNRTHEIGKVGVLEALRQHAERSDEVPPILLIGLDFPEEKLELSGIFGRKVEMSLPADATRKTIEAMWKQAIAPQEQKQEG